jgi:hypothetical protein
MEDLLDLAGSPWLEISNDDYHAGPGVSRSFLWDLYNTTPFHAMWRKQNRKPPTDAMILGSAVHALVLEPEVFKRTYVQAEVSRRSSKHAAVLEIYEDQGLIPLKADVWETAHRMADAVMSHRLAREMFSGGSAELALYARHPIWNHLEKIKVDYVLPDCTVVDLKTCQSAARNHFRSHATSMGYHVQAAMYPTLMKRRGLPVPGVGNFVFVAVESVEPHCVACYFADDEMQRDGLAAYERASEIYSQCVASGEWPAYPEEFIPLNSPGWARSQRREMT